MLRKYKKQWLLAAMCVMMIAGCRKGFLDTVPDNITTLDDVFTNKSMTEQWLGRCYSNVPDIWNQPYEYMWGTQSDEFENSWSVPAINSGAITPSDAAPNNWNPYYQTIRLCAIFIQNVDRNQELREQPNGATLITQYKAEARFLRAYYYWLLMRQYGPLVIMPEDPSKVSDNFQVPRSNWDECVNYVMAEMDRAMQDVPMIHTNASGDVDQSQAGRITKPIVLAVKSQVLLYSASPLFNGNTDLANFKNPDGKQLFPQQTDKQKWKLAADAAKAVIDLNRFELYKVTNADPFRAAFLSCRDLFWEGYKTEAIWIRSSTANTHWEQHCAPRSANGVGYSGIAPTQETVDAFRMANGLPITDPASGYAEAGFTAAGNNYYVEGTSNMYVGREPRFYMNITFNGSMIPVTPGAGFSRVEMYAKGNTGKEGAPRDWSKTGYTARKNLHPNTDFRNGKYTARPAMLIRLAEIFLNYAEAMNEFAPADPEAIKYLNLVRSRAGLPAISGGTQEQLRKWIRAERRVELLFEGHRFWDVRRWKVAGNAEDHQGGDFHGMNIFAGTSLSDPAFHQRVVAFTRAAWHPRLYFYPVPQSEVDRNKQLVQFPGY